MWVCTCTYIAPSVDVRVYMYTQTVRVHYILVARRNILSYKIHASTKIQRWNCDKNVRNWFLQYGSNKDKYSEVRILGSWDNVRLCRTHLFFILSRRRNTTKKNRRFLIVKNNWENFSPFETWRFLRRSYSYPFLWTLNSHMYLQTYDNAY